MKLFVLFAMFLLSRVEARSFDFEELMACRNLIESTICLVDPVDESNPYSNQYSRPCLPGGQKYQKIFENHFDRSAPVIKRMYCSLEKIWIENELHTTAFAVPIRDDLNNLVSGAIGVSRKFLDSRTGLAKWLSDKEASSFGGHENLLNYKIHSRKKLNAIDYVLNHEFAHILDYANNITKDETSSWPMIAITPFMLQKDFCFYQCGGNYIDPSHATDIFRSFMTSSFISTYASLNIKEDWAESFALYHSFESYGLTLALKVGDDIFDLTAHGISLEEKKNYYDDFMKSEFRYPGE